MAVGRHRAMLAQIGADLVEGAGRDLGAVAKPRHELAVIDHEASEGGLRGVRCAAELPDLAEDLLRRPARGSYLMFFEPHGCSPAVSIPDAIQEQLGGRRQPQTEWAGFMGKRPQSWAGYRSMPRVS